MYSSEVKDWTIRTCSTDSDARAFARAYCFPCLPADPCIILVRITLATTIHGSKAQITRASFQACPPAAKATTINPTKIATTFMDRAINSPTAPLTTVVLRERMDMREPVEFSSWSNQPTSWRSSLSKSNRLQYKYIVINI